MANRAWVRALWVACVAGTLACTGWERSPGPCDPAAAPAAFPGAEGAGAGARGGRCGDVYTVTHTADDGPGSLRQGIRTAQGPRTIVFAVGGSIALRSNLWIDRSYLTLAGQTAPGGGITLRDRQVSIRDAHDVVVRHLRFRPGIGSDAPDGYEPDALGIVRSRDVVVDHVSASWAVDEVLSVTHGSHRVTVQWSFITEALHVAGHHKGNHGYGSLIDGGDLSFHHNLYAHNRSRNPRPGTTGRRTRLLFANNVVYDAGDRFGYAGKDDFEMSYVANYGIAGPSTQIWNRTLFQGGHADNRIHHAANLRDLDSDGQLDGRPAGWSAFGGIYTPLLSAPELSPVRLDPALRAYERVLADAGASRPRDAVDARVVAQVREQGGRLIDSQADVGGWPELAAGTPRPDADADGMPDAWEQSRGLDPADPSDRNHDADGDGYTNLEEWLDELASG